jgi:hypothetical protein
MAGLFPRYVHFILYSFFRLFAFFCTLNGNIIRRALDILFILGSLDRCDQYLFHRTLCLWNVAEDVQSGISSKKVQIQMMWKRVYSSFFVNFATYSIGL